MFFAKNLPVWERVLRTVFGLAMAVGALTFLPGALLGYLIAASGAFTVLTAFVGWCPMCAIAGRKLKSQ